MYAISTTVCPVTEEPSIYLPPTPETTTTYLEEPAIYTTAPDTPTIVYPEKPYAQTYAVESQVPYQGITQPVALSPSSASGGKDWTDATTASQLPVAAGASDVCRDVPRVLLLLAALGVGALATV